jgi:hypothetical protein
MLKKMTSNSKPKNKEEFARSAISTKEMIFTIALCVRSTEIK